MSDGSSEWAADGATAFTAVAIAPAQLGDAGFRRDYGIKYAYVSGAMYKGISSAQLVVAMGAAGLIGYLGTGGLSLTAIAHAIDEIERQLDRGQSYGMNLLSSPTQPEREMRTVELYLRRAIRFVEAAAYTAITPALVLYRLKGARQGPDGRVVVPHRVMAKVSRPEVAEVFMRPAPPRLVAQLVAQGLLSQEEARLGAYFPMANEVCVEADSGGHTDRGVASVLMPSMLALRDRVAREQRYQAPIRIGAAGGIGTPEAAAAAFVLGADFVLTGSVNQCTVEAGTSAAVKDLLQTIDVQDTAYAPAGDMFESGAKVQVLKKGLLFPARANKLHELYTRYDSLEQIDEKTRIQIQEKYFRRSFDAVWAETEAHHAALNPALIERARRDPKQKMALVLRWYFAHASRLAMRGSQEQVADYQVHCGPALGAFNQWVKGTALEDWRARHCADIGERLMSGAAAVLARQFDKLVGR
ncbi:MAG: PfaD family polyunsaturated fatty acid/polyketide biosynthesis protein [Pseudomonadota bacterium]